MKKYIRTEGLKLSFCSNCSRKQECSVYNNPSIVGISYCDDGILKNNDKQEDILDRTVSPLIDKQKSMGEAYLELQNKKYDSLKFQSSLGKKILDDMFVDKLKDGKIPDVVIPKFDLSKDIHHFGTVGSRFNEGKLRWSLVDLKYLEGLVQVLMYGSEKYSDYNWQKGLPTLEVYESLMRHIVAWKSGEDKDLESGLDHIDHAICNLYFIKWMIANKPSFDTRRTIVPEQEFTEPKYPSENEK